MFNVLNGTTEASVSQFQPFFKQFSICSYWHRFLDCTSWEELRGLWIATSYMNTHVRDKLGKNNQLRGKNVTFVRGCINFSLIQECIPVGFVPPTAVAVSPATHAPAMHAPTMHTPGHAHPHHACPCHTRPLPCMLVHHTCPHPVNRITDRQV